jgi:hypothetical protein
MHIRSKHAALNTLLQGAGALICKKWIVETDRLLRERSLVHGWAGDYAFLIWAHDELQIACRTPEIAKVVACARGRPSRSPRRTSASRCRSTWAARPAKHGRTHIERIRM